MKYCVQCGRLTAGKPLFCSFCGRSYDQKLCPGRHVNPRSAEVCSQCGSRELSTPQPRISFGWKIFGFFLRVGLALFGLAICLVVLASFLQGMLASPQLQPIVFCVVILIGLLVWIWKEIPDSVQQIARWFIRRRQEDQE